AASSARIKDAPLVKSARGGVVPATVGLGLLLAYRMAWAPLAASRREGPASLGFRCALVIGSKLLVGRAKAPGIWVLWGTGALSALVSWWLARNRGAAA